MRVLILGFSKIKYMPYANFYLNNLNKDHCEIHFLYWNRDQKAEEVSELKGISLHEFFYKQQDEVFRLTKIKAFLKYRKYAKKVIKEIQPDFIIVLHTLPAVLMLHELRRYRDRFIFDYRDSTYEKFWLFRNMVHAVVNCSKATFVSSDAFRKFLPAKAKNKIFTSHNLLKEDFKHRNEKEIYGTPSEKIRLSFWGLIRNEEINRQIINKISNDERFELHYYGREQQTALNLKQYAESINARNVFFYGEYTPQDRYSFVGKTDIIHNIYSDDNMMLAMSNKYYDGITFRIPQICMPKSFMGKRAEMCGVGKQIDPYSNTFTQDIYEYYQGIDKAQYIDYTEKEYCRVVDEYKQGEDFIKKIFD